MEVSDRSSPPVAVIDIGSNSIKLLVASRSQDGSILELTREVEETRIGTGITGNPPRLREDSMQRAIVSIKTLLCQAAAFEPAQVVAVATSAVRDAVNGSVFAGKLFDATTLDLGILSGREEARLIGRGIACDPAMRGVGAFYLFDLGGGSLEILGFENGQVSQLASLQLGCVRVTEHCVSDPTQPLSADVIAAIRTHVRTLIDVSGFRFDVPPPASAVATGGTATTFRLIKGAVEGRPLDQISATIGVAELRSLAERVASVPIEARRAIPGLPAARADVFPAALLTLVEAAQLAGIEQFRHSVFNLRYGLASELLERVQTA